MSEPRSSRRPVLLVVGCLLAAAVILGVSFLSGSSTEFGGTDAAVTESIEKDGYQPWFQPVVSLDSGELEAGLFAVQAAAGAGVLGFVLGTLRERRRHSRRATAAAERPQA